MNAAKIRILEDTFNQSFSLEQFNRFTKEFFNEPEMFPYQRKTGIWKEYTEHISAYYKIANYKDENENKLIVLAVEIKKDKSVERARTMQRNFISKVLDENGYEAAIVAFYNPSELNWRLSFVRLDYSFTDKGLELDLTPARRYSYLVGESEPNHTAKAQLLPIFENDKENPTVDEIEKAFTVEKVTKEFFEQYKEKYIELKEYLEQDTSFIEETEKLGFEVPKFSEQFAKKLLGQLAFLYFIQKKGWLGVRILPKDRTLLESEYQSIYFQQDDAHRKILDRVFEKDKTGKRKIIAKQLVALNDHEAELFSDCFVDTEHEEEWGAGNKRFIIKLFNTCKKSQARNNFFHDFLQPLFYEALNRKRKNHYFNQFNCKVPFLNGGLFEPLEGYHWRDVYFNIPNSLFSNVDKKGRDADGILDIFERYNFTMNEDEPLEKEVAVDPEMIGKIFENLLDVKDRKSKGAFYTPREIVHYMCQESLANYLVNKVGVPYEDIKEFILYGDLIRDKDSRSGVGYSKELSIKPSIYHNLVKIDRALENVKVADPAVGSGAFPLGMLSEVVRARNNITDYLVILNKNGLLGRKFGEDVIRKNRSPFFLKWKTIKNSIFAVDIEPSAVDIAKLRLWLSVVVDQEINNETPEPQPLPNLDMNIMVGNSLIDEFEGIKLFDESVLKRKYDFIKEDSSEYAATTEQLSWLVDDSEKMLEEMFKLQDQYFGERNEQNKKDIKERIDKLRDQLIEYKLDRDGNNEGLKKYEELKKKKQKPYFLWYLEFAKVFQEKGGFDIVIGNPPYLEISDSNLKSFYQKKYSEVLTGHYDLYIFFFKKSVELCNNNGIISLITPHTFLHYPQYLNLRRWLYENTAIIELTNRITGIFESAIVDNVISLFSKDTSKFNNTRFVEKELDNEKLTDKLVSILGKNEYNFSTFDFTAITNKKHIDKYSSFTEKLGDIVDSCQGITVYAKAQGEKIDWFRNKIENEDSKPVTKGAEIFRYQLNWSGQYIQYGDWLWRKRKLEFFDQEKIFLRQTSDKIIATYVEDEFCCIDSVHSLIINNNNYHLKYILAILNSKLGNYFYKLLIRETGKVFAQVKLSFIKEIPIKEISLEKQKVFIEIVDKLLNKDNFDAQQENHLLNELDSLVYKLYEVTEEDISKIEGIENL